MVLGLDMSAKMAARTAVEPGSFPARTLYPQSVEHICIESKDRASFLEPFWQRHLHVLDVSVINRLFE